MGTTKVLVHLYHLSTGGWLEWQGGRVQEFSNILLEHTPDPQPTVYEGIPFSWGFRDSWGMLRGYVGVFLDRGEKGGTRMVAFNFCWKAGGVMMTMRSRFLRKMCDFYRK